MGKVSIADCNLTIKLLVARLCEFHKFLILAKKCPVILKSGNKRWVNKDYMREHLKKRKNNLLAKPGKRLYINL